jgi:hypothetical protein
MSWKITVPDKASTKSCGCADVSVSMLAFRKQRRTDIASKQTVWIQLIATLSREGRTPVISIPLKAGSAWGSSDFLKRSMRDKPPSVWGTEWRARSWEGTFALISELQRMSNEAVVNVHCKVLICLWGPDENYGNLGTAGLWTENEFRDFPNSKQTGGLLIIVRRR